MLFTLDKREYEAKLLQAKAQLSKAQADLAFAKDNALVESAKSNLDVAVARLGKAETDERRLKPLAERQAVPQQDYDDACESGCRPGRSQSKKSVSTRRRSTRRAASSRRGRVRRQRRHRPGGAGPELLHDPLADRGPDRQAPGGPRQPRRQGRGDAAGHRVEHRPDPRQRHHQRGGVPALRCAQKQGGRVASRGAGADPRRRQRLPAQGQAGHRRSGGGREDRHAARSSPSSRTRRDCCAPDSSAACGRSSRRPRNAILVPKRAVQEIQGMQERAGGRRRQRGRAAHHPARRETVGDLLIVRDGPEAGRAGDRGRDPEGPTGVAGQSDRPPPAVRRPRRRRRRGPGASRPRRSLPRKRGEIAHGTVLHPPADRRHRHLDPDRHARRGHDRRACRSSSIRSWRRRTSA
ncbi:MAG: hypothetical protein MZV64_73780 [Ignavibacteriales bacterium]|nr:hypothetical protein [Ignavibacteriales bacterium]